MKTQKQRCVSLINTSSNEKSHVKKDRAFNIKKQLSLAVKGRIL